MATKRKLTIGIDLGGTKVFALVLDTSRNLLARGKVPTDTAAGPEGIADQMREVADQALAKAGAEWADVACVGAAVPSAVDQNAGTVLSAPNLGWKDLALRPLLEPRFPCPVALENDVNCGVWGEFCAGAAEEFRSVAGFFVGTGLGGGLVLDGTLVVGTRGMSAEFGHEVIRYNGRKCGCGKRGCVEAYASKTAFCKEFQRRIVKKGQKSVLSERYETFENGIKSAHLAEAFRAGDNLTRKVVSKGMTMLGVASANVAAAFGPQCIVYGGGVMEAVGEELLCIVEASFRENLFGLQPEDVALRLAKLEDDAGAMGAALLAVERCGRETMR